MYIYAMYYNGKFIEFLRIKNRKFTHERMTHMF